MFGGRPAEEALIKRGVDPAMARNPNYQMASMWAGGDKDQADFNFRLLNAFNGFGGGGGGGGGGETSAPPTMNPASGLKAVLPGAKAKGGRAYRSYKDLDAGAGSGEGRLEKTEIQKRKR